MKFLMVLVVLLGPSLSMARLMGWPAWLSPAGSAIATETVIVKIEDAALTSSAKSYNAIQFSMPNQTGVYRGDVELFWHDSDSTEIWNNSRGSSDRQSGIFELRSDGSIEVSFPGTEMPTLRLNQSGVLTLSGRTKVAARFVPLSPFSSYTLTSPARPRHAGIDDFLKLSAPIALDGNVYSILKLSPKLADLRGTGIYSAELGNMNAKGVFISSDTRATWQLDTRLRESTHESVFLRIYGDRDVAYRLSFRDQTMSRSDGRGTVNFTPLAVRRHSTRYLTTEQFNNNARAARSLECSALFATVSF